MTKKKVKPIDTGSTVIPWTEILKSSTVQKAAIDALSAGPSKPLAGNEHVCNICQRVVNSIWHEGRCSKCTAAHWESNPSSAPPGFIPKTTKPVDSVDHPPHYAFGKHEPIDVIEDWGLGFSLGNAVKYISRAGRKDKAKELEDLKKARFYLNREIDNMEKKKP